MLINNTQPSLEEEKNTLGKGKSISDIIAKTEYSYSNNLTQKEHLFKVIAGKAESKLKIGELEIECYVFEGRIRVVSRTDIARLFMLDTRRGTALEEFFKRKVLSKYLQEEILLSIVQPLYGKRTKNFIGTKTAFIPADIVPDLCNALLDYRREKVTLNQTSDFTEREVIAFKQAELTNQVSAKLGWMKLVDEATGLADLENEYQNYVAKYVTNELQPWVKTFDQDYYKEIYRLKGFDWNRFLVDKKNHPWEVAHITNEIIYEKLPDEVLQELDRLNPRNDKGNRKHKKFQFLTASIGYNHLVKLMGRIIGIMEKHPDGAWIDARYEINTKFKSLRQSNTNPLFEI